MRKLFPMALIAALLTSCQTKQTKYVTFDVDEETSAVEWKGSAPDHFHVGSFKVTGSLLADDDGLVKSGDFSIPIASIRDFDLKDPIRQALLADLKDNFFKVTIHPEAEFNITRVQAYHNADTAAINRANYLLTGNFSMLGQTHAISFPANIKVNGDSLITEAKFNIDRTKWGMVNYSDPSGKLYILPQVNIHLKIKAAKDTDGPVEAADSKN